MDPKELLRLYHNALASGDYTREQIDADIERRTGGRVKSYDELARLAFGTEQGERERAATERVAEREPGIGSKLMTGALELLSGGRFGQDVGGTFEDRARAVGDFGTMARHGLTFGFDDELADVIPGGKTTEEARQRVADLRTAEPTGSALAEIAGGVAIPGMGAAGAASRGTGLLARAGRAGLAGGLLGAASGGLYGIGEAEGSLKERAEQAAPEAVAGGLIGTVLGGAGPVVGRALQKITGPLSSRARVRRLVSAFRGRSGIERTLDDAFEAADKAREQVQARFYRRFDDEFEQVADAGVREALQQPQLRTIVRSVSQDVAEGRRPPSFRELQIIRNKARGRAGVKPEAGDAGEILSQEMQRAISGLSEADQGYAQALGQLESLELGRTMTRETRPAAEARRVMDQLSPQEQEAFREGMIQEWVRQLERRDSAKGVANAILDAGPEMEARLRLGFPDDETFAAFMRDVRMVQRGRSVGTVLKRYGRWILGGSLAGAGFEGAREVF